MTKPHARVLAALVFVSALLAGCQSGDYGPERVVLIATTPGDDGERAVIDARPRAAAAALAASLTDEQRARALLPIDADARHDWHFVPRERLGLPLGEMSDRQKQLLHALMQTALSDAGYLKATDIIWLETLLAEMENNPDYRDAGKYAVIFFGDVSDPASAWGWRLEGHHLSVNLTYAADGVGVTPLFFGANPAVVPTGPLAGKRVLSDEHHLALELAQSMSEQQRAKMMLADKPRDVIAGPGREASLREPVGIHADDLTEDQYAILLYLLSAYGHNIAGSIQLVQLDRIQGAGRLSEVLDCHFAWAGPIDGSGPFYYRVQSPLRLIEYSMQDTNHVHTVVHDLTDPLQEDLLKKHFEQHDHRSE